MTSDPREHVEAVMSHADALAEDVVRLTQEFIRQRSPAPKVGEVQVADAQRWLADRLEALGCFDEVECWEVEAGHPNVVAVRRGAGGGSALMFNGHTDVVPVTEEQQRVWTGDPWSAEERDGRIWGRGASDMKGGIAAAISAVRLVDAAGVTLEGDVLLVANIGEEYVRPEIGVESVLARGYRAPLVISMEPTDLVVCPVSVGWFMFRLVLTGRSIHPSARHLVIHPSHMLDGPPGVDAVALMRRFMDAFDGLNRRWGLYYHHPLAPPGLTNIGPISIQGGAPAAAVPEHCEATFVVVVAPGRRSQDIVAEVRRAVDAVCADDPWLTANPPELELPVLDPLVYEPTDVGTDDPRVEALLAAGRDALGESLELGCMTAPSDANIISTHGHPVLVCGPGGQAAGVHGANEYVEIENLLAATKLYAALMLRWCGCSSGSADGAR